MSIGVEFHVSDVEGTIAFWEALGFQVTRRWEDWLRMVRPGDAGLSDAEVVIQGDAGLRTRDHYFTPHLDREPRGVGVEVTLEVGDVDALHAAARAAGLRIVKPIQDRDWKARDFRLAAPDGFFVRVTSPLRHG
jgi:lactoylglutathione lyase